MVRTSTPALCRRIDAVTERFRGDSAMSTTILRLGMHRAIAGELIVEVGPTLRVPVSRERAREVRQQLLENTVGIRQPG